MLSRPPTESDKGAANVCFEVALWYLAMITLPLLATAQLSPGQSFLSL